MTALVRDFWRDEAGLILSAEMVIILTISVLGMVVGLANLQNALLGEFNDLSMAFRSLNQSYGTPTYRGCWKWWGGRTSWVAGSSFIDVYDGCAANVATGCYGDIVSGGCGIAATSGQVVNEHCPVPTVTTPTTTTVPAVPVQTPCVTPSLPCPETVVPKATP